MNVFRDLESLVSEGGENFSEQLTCMARAILKQKKVVIMDEVTARLVVPTIARSFV